MSVQVRVEIFQLLLFGQSSSWLPTFPSHSLLTLAVASIPAQRLLRQGRATFELLAKTSERVGVASVACLDLLQPGAGGNCCLVGEYPQGLALLDALLWDERVENGKPSTSPGHVVHIVAGSRRHRCCLKVAQRLG